MKLCVDCKHHHHEESSVPAFDCHWCYAHISPVTGSRERRECERERSPAATGCRPEGKLWEPK